MAKVLFVGCTAVDVPVEYTPEIADVVKDIPDGQTRMATPEQQAILKKYSHREVWQAGDSMANTAAMLSAMRNDNVTYIGMAGSDEEGEFFRKRLAEAGVHMHPPASDVVLGTTTNIGYYTQKDTGDRVFSFAPGNSDDHMTPAFLPQQMLADADITVFEGYNLALPNGLETWRALNTLTGALPNQRRAMTLGGSWCVGLHREKYEEVIAQTDIIIGNRDEFCALYDDAVSFQEGLGRFQQSLKARANSRPTPPVAFITDGVRGGYILTPEGITHYPKWDIDPATIQSTAGAGDAFATGVLYGISHQMPYERAAMLGSCLGAVDIQQKESRLDDPLALIPSALLQSTPQADSRLEAWMNRCERVVG